MTDWWPWVRWILAEISWTLAVAVVWAAVLAMALRVLGAA